MYRASREAGPRWMNCGRPALRKFVFDPYIIHLVTDEPAREIVKSIHDPDLDEFHFLSEHDGGVHRLVAVERRAAIYLTTRTS
jgi:hypothetical protein